MCVCFSCNGRMVYSSSVFESCPEGPSPASSACIAPPAGQGRSLLHTLCLSVI